MSQIEEGAKNAEIHGVILVLSFPWKNEREFAIGKTLHEKIEIAALVMRLGFNAE